MTARALVVLLVALMSIPAAFPVLAAPPRAEAPRLVLLPVTAPVGLEVLGNSIRREVLKSLKGEIDIASLSPEAVGMPSTACMVKPKCIDKALLAGKGDLLVVIQIEQDTLNGDGEARALVSLLAPGWTVSYLERWTGPEGTGPAEAIRGLLKRALEEDAARVRKAAAKPVARAPEAAAKPVAGTPEVAKKPVEPAAPEPAPAEVAVSQETAPAETVEEADDAEDDEEKPVSSRRKKDRRSDDDEKSARRRKEREEADEGKRREAEERAEAEEEDRRMAEDDKRKEKEEKARAKAEKERLAQEERDRKAREKAARPPLTWPEKAPAGKWSGVTIELQGAAAYGALALHGASQIATQGEEVLETYRWLARASALGWAGELGLGLSFGKQLELGAGVGTMPAPTVVTPYQHTESAATIYPDVTVSALRKTVMARARWHSASSRTFRPYVGLGVGVWLEPAIPIPLEDGPHPALGPFTRLAVEPTLGARILLSRRLFLGLEARTAIDPAGAFLVREIDQLKGFIPINDLVSPIEGSNLTTTLRVGLGFLL